MKTIINNWVKQYGYEPTKQEIINAYYCGELILTDSEENAILKMIENE